METVFNEEKDVEGLSHTWIKRMYHNIRWLDDAKTKKAILPCTPLAVIKVTR
jgi:methylenetetrahydrofolate dehydrogenase (NAD+)